MGSEVRKETLDLANLLNAFELFVARGSDIFMEDPAITRLDGAYKVIIENKDDKSDNNWVHIHDTKATLLVGTKGPLGIYCYSDENEYRRIEEELIRLESFAAMRELAATYAHEIKNPLFSIRGFIQLLQKSFDEEDKRREYTDISIKELDRIQRIISEFLDLYRNRISEQNNAEVSYTVQQTIRDAINLFQNALEMKEISCKCDMTEDLSRVPISSDHLMQIFINLIQNSIDSMETGKSIYINVESDEDKVYITLRDEGIGIREENLEKVFSPFFSTKEKGTGLGLYITKQIIESCGGTISVTSIYEEGTTFLLELPRENEIVM